MLLRTVLNQNRTMKISLSVCALIAVAVVVGMQFRSADAGVGDGKHIFISTDDGKTFQLHASDQLPPFEVQGKTAYQANVFTCDGKTRFVGFLQRYTPQGKRIMEDTRKKNQAVSQHNNRAMPTFNAALLDGIEIKKPGDKEWVKQSDRARANKILDVTCPNENRPADPVIP